MPGEDEQAGAWHTGGANSSWARSFVVRREGEGDRSEDRTDRGEEPERAGHGQSLNSGASWALSHRKVAWEGVSTLSNAEVQAFPLDSSERNPTTAPPAPPGGSGVCSRERSGVPGWQPHPDN